MTMQDARQIAQRVDELLVEGVLPNLEEASAIASTYAGMSREAEERLIRCQTLMSQGLRSEAVQEAEIEPNLLLQIAGLELRDFSAWRGFCHQHGLPGPRIFRQDVVAELNRAYASEQQVSPLLREYRLLCVVRAPLTARLAAVRALEGVDRDNPVWSETLIDLEKHRLSEIADMLPSFTADLDALEGLARELTDERRKVAAPPRLVESVNEALLTLRRRRAQAEIESLVPALNEAYSAMDEPACRALVQQWTRLLEDAGMTPLDVPDPLREAIEPPLLWVERQTAQREAQLAFERSCQALESAVDNDRTAAELERALAEAERFEQPLPGSLGADARAELSRRIRAQDRQRRVRHLAAAAAALGFCAVLVWSIYQIQVDRDVEARLAMVRGAIENSELELAEARWLAFADSRPERADTPRAQNVRTLLDAAVRQDREREASFDRLAEQLASMPDQKLTDDQLSMLSGLARLSDEKERVDQIRERYLIWQARLGAANNQEALDLAAALQQRLRPVSSEAIDRDPRGVFDTASEALAQIDAMSRRLGVTDLAQQALAAPHREAMVLQRSARAVLDERERVRQRIAFERQLADHTYSSNALSGQLALYTERFPASPLVDVFRLSAGRTDAWEAVDGWFDVVSDWEGSEPSTLAEAAERIRKIEAHLNTFSHSPMRPALDAYQRYWGAAILASASDGPWLGQLPELLRSPIFRDLGMAQTSDGRRFYVVGDGNRRDDSLGTRLNVVLSPDTSQTTRKLFAPGELGPVVPSPASELANSLLLLVSEYDLKRWHTFPVEAVDTVLKAKDVDPVVRGVLIELLLNNLERATGRLHPGLEKLRDRIALHGDTAANWMNPDDVSAQNTRRFMQRVFDEPRDIDLWREELESERRRISQTVWPRVVQRAVLMPGDDGKPVAATSSPFAHDRTEAWAVIDDESGEQRTRFVAIGMIQDGQFTLHRVSSIRIPYGSMLWLVRPPSDQTLPASSEKLEGASDGATARSEGRS
jgi:hypothetical protein